MLNVVALISGQGTNLLAVLDACERPDYPVRVVAVGADREAPGLQFAVQRGIPTFVVPFERGRRDEWASALAERVDRHHPDLVLLSGLMRVLPPAFVRRYAPRIINTHPALLPNFPGAHAVADALAAGVPSTGATVHVVDTGVDTGPVLAQREVPVLPGDDEQTLHARIKVAERELLIQCLSDISSGAIDLGTGTGVQPSTQQREVEHHQ